MFNRKKVKKFSIAILIAGGIFAFFQFAFAQDTTEGAYETDSTSGSDTTEIPPPPGSVEVLREGDITFVLFDAGEYYSDVYAYHVYRRCGDSTWWSLNKVMVSDCSGSTCSYPVFDKPDTDTCEYAVSIINSAGIEGDKSPGERPVVSDTSEDTTTTNTDGTGGADDTSDITTDITTEEDPKDTTSDDIIYQEVSGKHIIYLSVDYADQVEWTMFPGGSETETYLGAAVFNKERGLWEYMWDTTKVPNGDYVLVPKIISTTGSKYKDTPTYVRVKNDVVVNETTTKEEDTLISIIEAAAEELDKVVEESGGEEEVAKEDVVKVLSPYIDKIQEYIDEKGEEAVKREVLAESEKAEEELRVLLNIESSKLLYSLDGDEEEFKRFENKVIIAAQKSIEEVGLIAKEFGIELDDDDLEELEKEVAIRLEELKEVIQERKAVLKDRVGDKVFEDTDEDGISNYDEVNIYKTNPFSADTDNDGFFDGAEILGGFDPLNAKVEAIVEYEQPRFDGFLEEDIFTVDHVAVSEIGVADDGKEDAKKITLKGTAPANSFVTVYIYSTPIIVLIKTDETGNWIYELDKELEDGNHEVYVAITDNAGQIYAKSKPLPFVKEAIAITIDHDALFGGNDAEPSVFRGKYLYIIILLIVAIIGWVLIRTGSSYSEYNET